MDAWTLNHKVIIQPAQQSCWGYISFTLFVHPSTPHAVSSLPINMDYIHMRPFSGKVNTQINSHLGYTLIGEVLRTESPLGHDQIDTILALGCSSKKFKMDEICGMRQLSEKFWWINITVSGPIFRYDCTLIHIDLILALWWQKLSDCITNW